MESSPIPPFIPGMGPQPDYGDDRRTSLAAEAISAALPDEQDGAPVAGPSTAAVAAPPRRPPRRAPRPKVPDRSTAYTSAWVPGLYNIKNPAGDYLQRESNVDVARQVSLARLKRQRAEQEEQRKAVVEEGAEVPPEVNPLSNILVIHPGSRNLRIGRASDFYPHEIPNCIARPGSAVNRGNDPPVPGARNKRLAAEHADRATAKKRKDENGEPVEANGSTYIDPVDQSIGFAREYLREKLRANRFQAEWRDAPRVKAFNNKVKPEPIPEHNDPYRMEWTEVNGKTFFIGEEALRLPPSSGFKVRYPILRRGLNRRDWTNHQMLMDDIGTIIEQSLRTELDITPKDYHKYSVVFLVPDHGDRFYVQEMTKLFLGVMGFKEIAVHQEAYAAIFAAGMSTACVVDIGAEETSVTCVDEGNLISDTRVNLAYGGDDITLALVNLMQRAAFPYRDLDLSRSQDRLMMDNIKIKICTLEEHLVANTLWDFYVLKPEGLTDKYNFRTFDENILAPLCFFDTRMIDFEEKETNGLLRSWTTYNNETIDDQLASAYGEPTSAMRSCTSHLRPHAPTVAEVVALATGSPAKPGTQAEETSTKPNSQEASTTNGVDTPELKPDANGAAKEEEAITLPPSQTEPQDTIEYNIVEEASKVPLDAAIAASIALAGATENKIKAAAASILLIGGSSALRSLGAFIADRLPSLLRARHLPIQDVSIVPPPRNLNPRFVSWKGACVMCNIESLNDMWIQRDEWEALGPRALKDRYLFF